jgi:transcriptional/translational regulatory protein YebC/TACO1
VIVISDVSNPEALELAIMETPAEDYVIERDDVSIYTDRMKLGEVRKSLETAGFTISRASFEYIPKSYIEVTDRENALKIYKILEEFGEDEDIEVVWNNADISDALWKEVEEKVEASKFRT